MIKKLFFIFLCATLPACSGTYTTQTKSGDYLIQAPAYVDMITGVSQETAIQRKAEDLCPNGYEKTGERMEQREGRYLEWVVKCH